MKLTAAALQDLNTTLEYGPERLERAPQAAIVHEEMARALRHVDDAQWRSHCLEAIELLTDDLAHLEHPTGEILTVALCYLWADQPDLARPFLERLIAHVDTTMQRRPLHRVPFEYYISLVYLRALDAVVEVGSARGDEGGKYVMNLVAVIEADRAGDRRTRDKFAQTFVDTNAQDFSQAHWYDALSVQMKTRGRFGRSAALPRHPPDQAAISDHDSYTTAFGTDAAITQIRAAQAGRPVDGAVLIRHAGERATALSGRPEPSTSAVQALAGLHRLAGDQVSSELLLEDLVGREGITAADRANALLILGRDAELVALARDHPDALNDYVVAYSSVASDHERDHAFTDLRRWSSKESPSAVGLSIRATEVLELAITRFGDEPSHE